MSLCDASFIYADKLLSAKSKTYVKPLFFPEISLHFGLCSLLFSLLLLLCFYKLLDFRDIQKNIIIRKGQNMKNFRRTLSLIFVLALIFATFSGCSDSNTQSTSSENDTIVVGMEISSDGVFESRDEDGNPWGVSVQLLMDFGEYAGKTIQIENVAWDGLIPSLETGKIDMILSSMTITDERAEKVDFSEPYANAYLAVLASADSDISSVDDLNQEGKSVAVATGSTGYYYAVEYLPNATILALSDAGACITEVIQGKADGFIRDQLSVYRANQQNPETKAVLIPFQDAEHWGAAFQKGNDELREQFNEFLEFYKEDGGFDRLTEDYMAEYKEAFDELGFKWFFDFEE